MTKYYSAATRGFYDSEINNPLPNDAVKITDEYYQQLLIDQDNGKRIQPDPNGYPIAVNPPAPTPSEAAESNKRQASQLLTESDWATKSSISDPAMSTPYLKNQKDFFAYQNQLRAIAVNPPTTLVTSWPSEPKAVWSN